MSVGASLTVLNPDHNSACKGRVWPGQSGVLHRSVARNSLIWLQSEWLVMCHADRHELACGPSVTTQASAAARSRMY